MSWTGSIGLHDNAQGPPFRPVGRLTSLSHEEHFMLTFRKLAVATVIVAVASAAQAGEITGNGNEITVNGRSECAFSGQNDLDGDPRDPGFKTQSYGQNVRLTPLNPADQDPNADAPFVPIPGFACNPNRGRDLHDQ